MIETAEELKDRGPNWYRITYACGHRITAMRYRAPKAGDKESCPKSCAPKPAAPPQAANHSACDARRDAASLKAAG